jgi:hypothetical protein
LKKTLHKNRDGGVTQDEGPEFKPQCCQKKEGGKEGGRKRGRRERGREGEGREEEGRK